MTQNSITYFLRLEIDHEILASQSKDNLCIARKVNNVFSTVLHGAAVNNIGQQQKLYAKNSFEWSDRFQVFCTTNFQPQTVVSASTEVVDINYGDEALYKNGSLQEAARALQDKFPGNGKAGRSATNSFVIGQVPSALRAGCSCLTTKQQYDPIFVDLEVHNGAMDRIITPSNDYVIFWDTDLTRNAIFHYTPTPDKKEFSIKPPTTQISLRFGYATPNQPIGKESAQFYSLEGVREQENDPEKLRWVLL